MVFVSRIVNTRLRFGDIQDRVKSRVVHGSHSTGTSMGTGEHPWGSANVLTLLTLA